MKRATKKKPAPVEPLPPAPIQMSVQEPAAPATSTWTQSSPEIDAPMSPEKTEVTRLYARANQAQECVNGLRQAMRYCKREEVCIKGAMYMKKRKQDLVPKARTRRRSWQSGQQMSSCWLSARQTTRKSFGNGAL